MRKFTSFATATAIVLTSVAAVPAEARGRYGHGGWGYRDRDHISTGEVIGGLLVLGTIAAVIGAASKDKTQPRDRDYPYEPPYREPRQDAPNYEPQGNDDSGAYGSGTTEVRPYGDGEAEARASDACSWAVEGEIGNDARVDSITGTEPNNGGWYVTGTASRLGGEVKSFGCSYKNGRVVDVSFG
jgi:hypothetical protein